MSPSAGVPAGLVYGRGALRADRIVHGTGLLAGPIAAAALIAVAASQRNTGPIAGIAVYALCLLAMIVASASYNLARPSPRKEWLRRFDHAAIFLLIAGTYTPFAFLNAGGIGALALVWIAAAGGVALKLAFPRRFETLSTGLYLLLGWTVLAALWSLTAWLPTATIVLLLAGGLLYSVGVLFHLATRLPGHNAIWHGFVLAAASCHYAAVLDGVAFAARAG